MGCSLSTCSWEYNVEHTKDIRNTSHPGWWKQLNTDHQYEVHAFIAGGLYTYLSFFKLIKDRLKTFDAVILQETFEPRISKLPKEYLDFIMYDNCKVYTYYCNRPPVVYNKVNNHLAKCINQIDTLLSSYGIPTYVFAWHEENNDYKWAKYLGIDYLSKMFLFNKNYHLFTSSWFGHFNLGGNEKIGKIINRELRKKSNGRI